ncbi:REn [Polygala garcinii associated virus]|uniref:Replication enhancer n=1 Tax=Polygala garcinii associated virus TaxID=2093274 RepID=A0A2I8B2K5_9GEMI|nr:REn [Polygala garcinii associated virus]AUT11872.1 REn [Polygala garcinii associated virus]
MDSRTGEPITAPLARNGVFTWTVQNALYFKITQHDIRPALSDTDIIHLQIRFNHNLRRALGMHKCYLNFRTWTRLQPQTSRFLRVFRYQVLKFLDSLGVYSLNTVIRAVDHVLYEVLENTISVNEEHDIKYKLY